MAPLRKYRADILSLLAYLFLAILLTFPLVLNFATHVAGDGSDDPALAWNLWWVPYSLLNLGASPIHTNYMFYPIGLNLAFYTLTYLNAFIAMPIQWMFNLVVAANVNLLLSFALSGFGAYLLVKYLLRGARGEGRSTINRGDATEGTELAAFVAGALYAFSSDKFLYASLGQFNIASSQWIPFYVLFLLKLTNPRRWPSTTRACLRDGFLLGLFLLFQALSELIFASFLIIFTAIYLLCRLLATRLRLINNWRLLLAFLVAALTFLIPMLPILAAMLQDMLTEGDFIQSGLGFADVFSNDLLGFFIPSHLQPILGGLESQFHFAYANFAYFGFAALILAAIGLWKHPSARIWGLFGAVFVLISLGPVLRVNGSAIPVPFLPFNLLLEIPVVKGNRYPSRWSVMVTLALAVLVGYGVAWLSQKTRVTSRGLSALVPIVFLLLNLFEHLSIPLPLSDFQIPDAYQTIAQDKGDFSVLELPLAWRNGFRVTGTLDAEMMFEQWYQSEQQHPILGGNTSRNPELKFQYFTEVPVVNSLIAVETGHTLDDATLERDRTLAPAVLQFFGVRYVVWHSPRDPRNRVALDSARAYVQSILPVKQISDVSDDAGETALFRVVGTPPQDSAVIVPSDPLARLNFAEGWGAAGYQFAWATRNEARLFARLDAPADRVLSFRVFAPMPDQRLSIEVNGTIVGTLGLSQGEGDYAMPIASGAWRAGMNDLVLHFSGLIPVGSASLGNYAIGTSGVTAPASIVVRSAGSEVGDFAHIFVDGVDAAQNTRGYNLVVVNPQTGAVVASAAFDTFASEDESARLAQFVDQVPGGSIVVAAVRDEGSRHLTAEAVNALRSIGATQDLTGKNRWSHAVIGVKGAVPGSVPEAASETWPAQLVVGIGAMEPKVAAAFESIKIEAK